MVVVALEDVDEDPEMRAKRISSSSILSRLLRILSSFLVPASTLIQLFVSPVVDEKNCEDDGVEGEKSAVVVAYFSILKIHQIHCKVSSNQRFGESEIHDFLNQKLQKLMCTNRMQFQSIFVDLGSQNETYFEQSYLS